MSSDIQTARRETPSSAWKPGQGGNPGGRPKISAEIRDLARDHGAQAIERLVALMHSKNDSVAVRAAEALRIRAPWCHGMELMDKEEIRTATQVTVVFVKRGRLYRQKPLMQR